MPNSMEYINSSKGSALLFSVLILSVILGVGLGISTIMVQEFTISQDVKLIVPAFYGADAGIERMLYRIRKDAGFVGAICQGSSGQDAVCDSSGILSFSSDATYIAHIYEPGYGDPLVGTCPGTSANWCIFSTGTFRDFARKIRASF